MPSACCFQTQHACIYYLLAASVRATGALPAQTAVHASSLPEVQVPGCVCGKHRQQMKCRTPHRLDKHACWNPCAMQGTDASRTDGERASGAVAPTASSLQVTTMISGLDQRTWPNSHALLISMSSGRHGCWHATRMNEPSDLRSNVFEPLHMSQASGSQPDFEQPAERISAVHVSVVMSQTDDGQCWLAFE